MDSFTDSKGTVWRLPEITTRLMVRLRDDHGMNLREALKADMGTLSEALGDDEKVAAVCWLLCEPQAKAAGIDPNAWLDLFDGQTYQNAVTALLSWVWTFFRGPEKAAKAVEALRAAMGWTTTSTSSSSAGS